MRGWAFEFPYAVIECIRGLPQLLMECLVEGMRLDDHITLIEEVE